LIKKISSGEFAGKQFDWGGWAAKVSKQEILDFITEIYGDPKAMPHLMKKCKALWPMSTPCRMMELSPW
jgi:hypothetical protein